MMHMSQEINVIKPTVNGQHTAVSLCVVHWFVSEEGNNMESKYDAQLVHSKFN